MRYFFFSLFLFFTFLGNAQQCSFLNTEYMFDTLYEGEEGNAIFIFKNEGKDTLYFRDVRSDCGCVAPRWSREPILPGKCSMVGAVYNTRGRLGVFTKTLTVFMGKSEMDEDSKDEFHILSLKGVVETGTRPNTTLHFNSRIYDAGSIKGEEIKYFKIDFKNSGKRGLKISEIVIKGVKADYTYGREYQSCKISEKPFVGNDEIIKAGESGVMVFKIVKQDEIGQKEFEAEIKGNFKSKIVRVKVNFL